ncbi:MinD/ParA family ATP-binding protein [Mycobacterium celatum]|uniref:Chromosome partitioning protein ParA n=1 Tax=Mycobacterium celatum TaxID=28045 RepID=A0A1X1RIQ7_MYCCE|nr:MinD/ParA family protein [Mycobacterium celatum]ORV06968.1 chromosome partitioning protein ParA [Mycobacterium celatum]PIB78222.1 MinD/ParA family protein [Mycobacterium celatum]
MSADYDRLFNAPEDAPGDATTQVDLESIRRFQAPMPTSPQAPTDAPVPPMPIGGQGGQQSGQAWQTQAQQQQPPRSEMPIPQPNGGATGMHRSAGAGAQYEQPRTPPPPPPQMQPAPAPSQHFAESQPETGWRAAPPPPSQPTQTSAATIGNHRAIDALSHVGVKSAVKMPSQQGWRHWLYLLTRVNLGLSPDELYELDLQMRVRRNARDSYQIAILGLKGGVGKTAVTVALGSALAKVRGDRILAIDADPGAGNLADRTGRQSAATIADLLADKSLSRYNDIRAHTSMNTSNLEVLSSEEYSVARRAFNDEDWKGATEIVSRYYNLVLADCGTGLFDSATQAVLETVSGIVIVASASIDGARQAAVAMDWLRQNGYQDLLSRACVVINHVVPGKPNLDVDDLVQQFERHLQPGRVLVLPYDKHIASGTEIQLDLLGSTFQRRVLELAAALSDDFDRLERR